MAVLHASIKSMSKLNVSIGMLGEFVPLIVPLKLYVYKPKRVSLSAKFDAKCVTVRSVGSLIKKMLDIVEVTSSEVIWSCTVHVTVKQF